VGVWGRIAGHDRVNHSCMGENARVQQATLDSSPRPMRGARLPYLPGLDGLRAIAVMSVLLYHGDVASLPGGFLGVEVFFVISGYLISALLLAERKNTGAINLGRFWLRRARRLLPALFLLLAVTAAIAVIFLPDEVASLRGDIASAFAYITNWNFIFTAKSYFEQTGRPSLVKHLWSLAVEEQFYLIWPVLFTLGMRKLGRRGLLYAVLAGAVASALLMAVLYHPDSDPSRVYYGTDTRASGLLIGCALAFVWSPWRLHRHVTRGAVILLDAAGAVGLVLLGLMLMNTGEFESALYRGGFMRLSLITALVIAVIVHPAAHLGAVLGIRPLRWIGLRSYGIYLWHWPVFQLTRPGLDISLSGFPLLALRLVLTFAIAEASFRFIEVPVRSGALSRRLTELKTAFGERRRQLQVRWLAVGAVATACTLVLVAGLVRATPPPPPEYVVLAGGTETDAAAQIGMGATPGAPPVTDASADASSATTAAPPTTLVPGDTTPASAVPVTNKTVVAVGDSVMLGASPTLTATFGPATVVDAAVGRQVKTGIDDINYRKSVGQLGDVLVIQLGNNGTFTDEQFDEMMAPLSGMQKVVFVNCKVPRRWEAPNNEVIANGVARYPNTVLVDWYSASVNHPEYFYDDGMHLRPPGAQAYAQLIASYL